MACGRSPASRATAFGRFAAYRCAAYRFAALDLSPCSVRSLSWLLRRLLPCCSWGSAIAYASARGRSSGRVRLFVDALPLIVPPRPLALLLRTPFLWAIVLLFPLLLVGLCGCLCLGLWTPLRPSYSGSPTVRRRLLRCSRLLPCSMRCLARLLCRLLILRSWGSVVAYTWVPGRPSTLSATVCGRFAALCPTVPVRSLAPLLYVPCFEVAMPPSAPVLVGLPCGPCLGPWELFRPLCECACALRRLSPLRSPSLLGSLRCLLLLVCRVRLDCSRGSAVAYA